MSDQETIDEGRPEEPVVGEDAALLRELIVGANPDVVPELIQGASLREMLASLPAARAAYTRVAEAAVAAATPPVPSGSAIRSRQPNVADLSPAAKIRAALDAARR